MAAASPAKKACISEVGGGGGGGNEGRDFIADTEPKLLFEVSRYFKITPDLLESWYNEDILVKFALYIGRFNEFGSFKEIETICREKATEVGKKNVVIFLKCKTVIQPTQAEFFLLENLKTMPFYICKRTYNAIFKSLYICII
jgi:hypothetical protein